MNTITDVEANKMTSKTNHTIRRLFKSISIICLSATSIISSGMAVAVNSSTDYRSTPPTITSGSANTDPLVMLAMSNDHQLYAKAYTDYTDLDGDGDIDKTYEDNFDYYGYFDSKRCYSYAANKFSPQEAATGPNLHHCSVANWSGNFLNWASMTRMDVIRKVLFGGTRSTDTPTSTTLERVLLPTDVHAFVKTFETASNAEMRKYTPYNTKEISMCNVTRGSGPSQTATEPPLLRVASGLWPGWSSNERTQCLYRDENSGGLGIEPPSSTNDSLGNLVVRVDVCVPGKEEANCKTYGTNKKPTGLLQKFGERDSTPIRFGLMTGSYARNMSGGVLRKDISKLLGNSTTSLDEINSATGQFIPGATGIINTISRFRISNYDFYPPYIYDDCDSPGILTITEGSSSEGCSAWGNPIAEIYMEALRYFVGGGLTPTPAFNTSDAAYITSLPQYNTWADPLDNTNYCANCSVVVISTGLNSFDTNQLGSASAIPGISGASAVDTKTDTVGSIEGISGNYIIGEGSVSSNQQCTSKSVTNFSDAKGICPELPTLKGGFQIAGLAYHAHITDLRTNNTTFPGKQKINTYSISLAESLPSFSIPVGSNTVTFAPHCEANSTGGAAITSADWRICSLADVTIESIAADQSTGSLLFSWEDSTWGYDYDMDGVERITWCVGAACGGGVSSNEIQFTASSELTAAGHAMLFGYTISGTTSDGVKRHVLRPGGQNFNQLYPPFNNAGNQPVDVTTKYTASGSSAALFNNPLWYAAKYGSFNDLNNNNEPDLTEEWDNNNNRDSSLVPDGIPDNFFQVTNPALLETQLEKIFNDILARTSSGSALSILSTNSGGNGAIYQALYDPSNQAGTKTITWGGRVHAFFVDDKGYMREDAGPSDTPAGIKGKLDGYSTDKIVELFYSAADKRTLVQRYTTSDSGATTSPDGAPTELSTLKSIWNARDELAKLEGATIGQQRTYTNQISNTGASRYILTWKDTQPSGTGAPDGIFNSSEVVDFVTSSFGSSLPTPTGADYGLLNVSNATDAFNIVNYIRGQEITGLRSRTLDFIDNSPAAAADEVWRLGDIIHSSPVVIAAPASGYYDKYFDTTYQTFAAQYSARREVLYTGANDGMIHAFNSGFYESSTKTFKTSNSGETAHPLGAELWAYIPFNLLPHLKWLTENNYPHVYYMDGKPQVFDVNIFPANADHPGGWGTILVAGMRLGGGELSYDHDGNAVTPDVTTRSAYVVVDITNPEKKPVVLAEISHPDLGFTTSVPSLAVKRVPGSGSDWSNPSTNQWYLVFGSGPTELANVTSTQDASIFTFDLNNKTLAKISPTTAIANSFVGDPRTADWNSDFSDDVVYFGTVGGSNAAPTGQLMRLVLDTMTPNVMLNPSQPFTSAPMLAISTDNWIYTGSGRLFAGNDNASITQQSYYGIKDPAPYTTQYTVSGLQNVTGVKVFADASLEDPNTVLPTTTTTFTLLQADIAAQDGWYKNLEYNGIDPSTRSLSTSLLFDVLVLFTAYNPPLANACIAEGTSSLFALYFGTGTAYPGLGLGTDSSDQNGDGSSVTIESVDLGQGLASAPSLLPGSGATDTDGNPTVIVGSQMATSAITRTTVSGTGGGFPPPTPAASGSRTSWREIFDF